MEVMNEEKVTIKEMLKMIENMKSHIGDRVIVSHLVNKIMLERDAILNDVKEYDYAMFTYHKLPFIVENGAIYSVRLDKTGELLYVNPYVFELSKCQEENKKIELVRNMVDKREIILKDDEKVSLLDDEMVKMFVFLKDGYEIIRPENLIGWNNYVCDDIDGLEVYYTLIGLHMLNQNESIDKLYNDIELLDNSTMNRIMNNVSYFSNGNVINKTDCLKKVYKKELE